ncbi:hypothetical protein [Nocardia abscessus]|uniref:hypothetical protein n=1 Tax=Nocardia abscessus TaxID=120957 RepID=UPI002455E2AE|nr:hypothetical protein [Nocardia abscessus]
MDLPTLPWESIGIVGVVVGVAMLVITGKLVPLSLHNAIVDDLRAQIAAFNRRDEARERDTAMQIQQNSTLLVRQAEIWDRVLSPADPRQESGNHVAPTTRD